MSQGLSFAVEGRTNHSIDPETSIRRILEMLGAVPAGHVAVYEPSDTTCAHFGELSATSLQAHGVAGVVINGGCRDVDLVRESGLPVFARYRTPQDAVSRWEVLDWGHEIEIEGVTVATGDYIVGDADGVAVIPHDLIETVLAGGGGPRGNREPHPRCGAGRDEAAGCLRPVREVLTSALRNASHGYLCRAHTRQDYVRGYRPPRDRRGDGAWSGQRPVANAYVSLSRARARELRSA